jgi:hypothetical protein
MMHMMYRNFLATFLYIVVLITLLTLLIRLSRQLANVNLASARELAVFDFTYFFCRQLARS